MTYSAYIAVIFLATVVSWTSFVLVFIRMNPYITTATALITFMITLFLALTGTFTLIGFYVRLWWLKNSLYYHSINTAFRQGALLSLMVCAMLGLQAFRALNWWDGLIVIIIVTIIEFSFLSKRLK